MRENIDFDASPITLGKESIESAGRGSFKTVVRDLWRADFIGSAGHTETGITRIGPSV